MTTTPGTLREVVGRIARRLHIGDLVQSDEVNKLYAAVAAWEFTLDDAAGMTRQLEADREQLREYGEEIFALRKRLETTEHALVVAGNTAMELSKRLEEAEKENRALRANTSQSVLRRLDAQAALAPDAPDTITDGYMLTSVVCPECGKATMQVVRPGKVQCSECG